MRVNLFRNKSNVYCVGHEYIKSKIDFLETFGPASFAGSESAIICINLCFVCYN